MGAAARTLKEAADKNFVSFKNNAADRALPIPLSNEAVNAAPDVHEPVSAAVQGGESQGFYQLSVLQFGAAYRAGLGISGCAFTTGFGTAAAPEPDSLYPSPGGDTHAEEEGIAEPKQDDSQNYKNQNLKYFFHPLAFHALAAVL